MTVPSACPDCQAPFVSAGRHNPRSGQFYDKFRCGTKVWHDPHIPVERTPACYERKIAALRSAGHILAMRLLQSSLDFEDDERAAMDAFLPQPETKETK